MLPVTVQQVSKLLILQLVTYFQESITVQSDQLVYFQESITVQSDQLV